MSLVHYNTRGGLKRVGFMLATDTFGQVPDGNYGPIDIT
jgi:hypothetical protein